MNTKVEIAAVPKAAEMLEMVALSRLTIFQALFNLEESHPLLKDMIGHAREADYVAIESSSNTLKISSWNEGETESERRSFSIDVTVLKHTGTIPQAWEIKVGREAQA